MSFSRYGLNSNNGADDYGHVRLKLVIPKLLTLKIPTTKAFLKSSDMLQMRTCRVKNAKQIKSKETVKWQHMVVTFLFHNCANQRKTFEQK